MEIGRKISMKAKEKGICKEWFKRMRASSVQELCDMYFEGDDWAMENDFPSLEMLREFKDKSVEYGLFTDYQGKKENVMNMALFGGSDMELSYSGFFAGKLIVRHKSSVEVDLKDYAFLMVNVLDEAEVVINARENARVIVCNYSDKSTILSTGNVKVKKSIF